MQNTAIKRAVTIVMAVACMLAADVSAGAGPGAPDRGAAGALCQPEWLASVAAVIPTDDGHGHGPDIGSDEWKSVVEFRLGLRGRADVPARNDPAWCALVDRLVRGKPAPLATDTATAAGPSFPCAGVRPGSVEALVCADPELAALDRALDAVYAAATARANAQHPPALKAEQRGWVKGRDECWKSPDQPGCVRRSYLLRIAELEARYGLAAGDGPYRYVCGTSPADEVVVTFFATDPPTLMAERGDQVSLMYRREGDAVLSAPAAGPVTYRGRNEWLRLPDGRGASGGPSDEVVLVWGHEAPELRCRGPR